MLKRRPLFIVTFAVVILAIAAGIVAQAKSENVDYSYVEARIEKMISNPEAMLFSSSGPYIEKNKTEYLDIYKLGEKSLPALEKIMSEEDAKGVHGLRYVLAGQIKQDIINRANYFDRFYEKQDEIDQATVAKLVEDFGRKLQTVSIEAPKDVVSRSMQENYGNFISPALLAEWLSNPLNAPGRVLSSPWPDRIEILGMEKVSENVYEVKGEIIEITSLEIEKGGFAAKRPITLIAEKSENRWLIAAVTRRE